MALGFGGQERREQKANREQLEAEMKFEREQQGLGQAGRDEPENRDSELIRWQQMDEEVEKACMTFRGMEMIDGRWQHIKVFLRKETNPKTNKVRKYYRKLKPRMNEEGINWFKGRLSPLVSKNIIMSNLDEPRILQTLRNNLITLIIEIGLKQNEFEIATIDLPTIKRIYQDLFSPALFRSLQNGERKFLTQTSRRVESIVSDGKDQVKKKGILDGLIG